MIRLYGSIIDEIITEKISNAKPEEYLRNSVLGSNQPAVDQFVIQSISMSVKAGELLKVCNERGAFTELLLVGLGGEGHTKTMGIESCEYLMIFLLNIIC